MRLRVELTYDAPPDRVLAMLADPAFREAVARAQQVVSVEVTHEATAGGFRIVSDQQQNTADLPAVARKFAGETTRAVVTETWTGERASVEIVAPGKPTRVEGTSTLTASTTTSGTGCEQVVDLDVRVKVPLVGGKLEQLMVEAIRAGYDVESRVGRDWLEGKR